MEKLRIAICDENTQEADGYAQICRSICENNNVPIELKCYTNNNSFLFDAKDDAYRALLSILIVEPEGDFAAIPATVRKQGYDGLILYLSHSTAPECYHQAFDVDAFNFVQKDTDHKTLVRFQEVFANALTAARQLERQYIVLSCAGEYRQIEIKDVYYFEAMDKMVRVEYNGGIFQFVSTLQSLYERLDGRGFVRTHRSYIVAIDAISRLDSDELTLNNGRKIPVSRSYFTAVKSAKDRWQL